LRLKLQSAPLRHESQVISHSSPNVPGKHSAQSQHQLESH